jgi:hypothetical protein
MFESFRLGVSGERRSPERLCGVLAGCQPATSVSTTALLLTSDLHGPIPIHDGGGERRGCTGSGP